MPVRFHTIHVFLLLPEPLDLPSGFAIQRQNQPGTYTGESFRVWDGARLAVADLLGGPISRFFHRQVPIDISRTSAAVSLAQWAWPSLVPDDTADMPDVDDAEQAGAHEPVKMQTAAELIHVVSCPERQCSGRVGEEFFERTIHHGLRMVQALQRAAYALNRQPYTLLTKTSAAFVTPVAIGTISDGTFEAPRTAFMWQSNWNMLSELPPAELSDAHLGAISRLIQHIDARVFFGFLDFQRESVVAYKTRGDNRSAAILMGLACERLLDDLLCHLMWEDGEAPEAAPATFLDQVGITRRVRREFHPRLKGSWSTDQAGPVADWWEKIAKIRNKVVHGSYSPTDHEIEDGGEATNALVAYVSDLLVDRVRRDGKYRLTALALMGEPGMRQRGVWTRRSQDAAKRFDDEDLWALASRWKAAAERQRAAGFGDHVAPDDSRAHVMYVVQPKGSPYWVQHDRISSQARLIGQPQGLTVDQQRALAKWGATLKFKSGSVEVAFSADIDVVRPVRADILRSWGEEYLLVPNAEVMVDGTDRSSMASI